MTKTMKISNRLRWLKTENGPILQQAWQCIETGEIEWEDVPTETGETNVISRD